MALRLYYWQERAEIAERILYGVLTPSQLGHASHLSDLEKANAELRELVTNLQADLRHANQRLTACNLLVRCLGPCGAFRGDPSQVTEDVVDHAERIAKRLRDWWEAEKRYQACEHEFDENGYCPKCWRRKASPGRGTVER